MYDELPVRHNDVPAEHDMAAHLPSTPLRARHRHQQSRRRDAGAQQEPVVLVVDDQVIIREVVALALEDAGLSGAGSS